MWEYDCKRVSGVRRSQWIYIYICIYIHMYIWMCIYICICMYICIHWLRQTPPPRVQSYSHMFLRTLKHYGLILVRFVALISRAVSDHKTWIWDHLGSILVTWGSILVSFWRPWPPLEPSWATFGGSVEKGSHFSSELVSIWGTFLAPKSQKSKKIKKTVSGNECRKYVLPEPTPNRQKLIF